MMLKFFKINAIRMFRTPQIYVSIMIVIIASIVTFQNNNYYYNLYNIENIGAINLFLFSNVINSLVLVILAPLVAVLPFCDTLLDDYKSGFVKSIVTKISASKYYFYQIFYSCIIGGTVFCITFFMELGLFALLDQSASVMISPPNGIFANIYAQSMFEFCITFIINSYIFGFVFALFGCGIAMNVRNKIYIYVIPVGLYYISSTLYQFLPERFLPDFLYFIIPYHTFGIYESLVPGYQFIAQYIILTLFSLLLITMGIKRKKAGFNL